MTISSGASAELSRDDGVAVLRLIGEIDAFGTADIREQIDGALGGDEPTVVVDLSGVAYLDSGGVRLILEMRKRLGEHRRLGAVVPSGSFVHRILTLLDLPAVVPIYETVDEAVRSLA